MENTKGKLIFKSVLAAIWNLVCVLAIWFLIQGIITSLELDMAEYVWIWFILICILLIPYAFSVRCTVRLKKKWTNRDR